MEDHILVDLSYMLAQRATLQVVVYVHELATSPLKVNFYVLWIARHLSLT